MTLETLKSSNLTLHPPTSEDEILSWIRLLRSRRVGISTFYKLMREHGNAEAALDELPRIAQKAGVSGYETCSNGAARQEWEFAQRAQVQPLFYGSPSYPRHLATIKDPPPILWTKGNLDILNRPRVAVVGARNASAVGTRFTMQLASELGEEGWCVVSGLARGIDTAAHQATVETGTIAVHAGGVDVVYPKENAKLADDIAQKGLRVSEQPIGLAPAARHFPTRNRIISGLATAVVVIEATLKSGALITAQAALDQGREIFCVPGHPFDGRASGCNALIRDGARLIRGAADVIEGIEIKEFSTENEFSEISQSNFSFREDGPAPERRSLQQTAALHQQILERIGTTAIEEDRLIRDLKSPTSLVSRALTQLELQGQVTRLVGGLLRKAI